MARHIWLHRGKIQNIENNPMHSRNGPGPAALGCLLPGYVTGL